MSQEDINALWAFFLQNVQQCVSFERLGPSCQETLREKTYQACISAVLDSLTNLLAELANLERSALICNASAASSSIIKAKLQNDFVKKLQHISISLTKQSTANCFLEHDIKNLFFTLSKIIQLEQLESNNNETLQVFVYIMISSLVPILSCCVSSSKDNHCDDTEQLKTIVQLQSSGRLAKNKNSPLILLNTIIDALTMIEKSNIILSKMCNSHDETAKEVEAVSSCMKLIVTELQENLRLSNLVRPIFGKEKRSKERNENKKPIRNIKSNAFLQNAATSLRSGIKHRTEEYPESGVQEKNLRKSHFLLLNRIEEIIKKELTKSTTRTCHLILAKLFSDYSFMDHIRGLRKILFMQAGTIMEQFSSDIVCKIEAASKWNQESWLTLSLHNCMSSGHFAWFSNYLSVELGYDASLNNTGVLPELTINYAAPWPISDIILQDSLQLYNRIFRFLLKVKFNLITLQRLSYKDLGSSPANIHYRLFWLRNWMMHFLSSVYTYLMECVLEPLYVEFDAKALNCNHMEHLALVHQEYIRNIHHGCFLDQGSEFVNQPIREIADFTDEIIASWNSTSSDSAIHEMENKIIYRYGYVISVLNSPACRSTFQNVETLASSLNFKHPTVFGKH